MTDPEPPILPPGPRTLAALEKGAAVYQALPMRVKVTFVPEGDAFSLSAPHNDPRHQDQLRASLGSASSDFMTRELAALEFVTRRTGEGGGDGPSSQGLNAALALIEAVGPTDELEGALAIQMAANHALTMEAMGRARHADRTDTLALYGNLAVKLQRTFTAQVEALAKLRGKGQQTVRVEHVTVAAGAQAIIGEVHHHQRGEGSPDNAEAQPHGQYQEGACGAALPGPDPARNGVPIPSDAERSLSPARRQVARRTTRKPARAKARVVES